MENKTLMTDFYELTMAQTYFDQGKQGEEVYFDIFFRKNPFNGGYTISGGLEETINYIKNFNFNKEEINYLKSLNQFSEKFLNYLETLKFEGDIYSVPDGTVVFPNETVLTVKAPIIMAQLLETALLANFNHASLVTTAAKRITNEAGDIPVMEFGARRARGIESAVEASKYAYIGGCCGTSNTLAGMKYNIPVLGTMAHSLLTESNDEYQAFLNYAKSNKDNCVFLVDTYDTLKSGIPNAIKVANDYLKPNGLKFKGIRIDSGDLAYLSKKARKMLDEAGYPDCKICASNALDEYLIRDMIYQGAKVDMFGVGERLITAKSEPVFGGVYKLAAVEDDEGNILPKIKISENVAKITTPHFKKLYRIYDKDNHKAVADLLCIHDEVIDESRPLTLFDPQFTWKKKVVKNFEAKPIQQQIFKDGKCVYKKPAYEDIVKYAASEINTLWDEITRFENPHTYYVDLSQKLWEVKNYLLAENNRQTAD